MVSHHLSGTSCHPMVMRVCLVIREEIGYCGRGSLPVSRLARQKKETEASRGL